YWKTRDLLRRRGALPPPAAAPDGDAALPPDSAEAVSSVSNIAPGMRPGGAQQGGELILDVQGLSRSFGGLKAVHNVSFQVRKGMILGIIGPNGAGKTTLFNLLNGFLKPDAGRVRSEEHTSELQSRENLVCRLLLEKKKQKEHS